ncbi:3-hydroxyacyl-CoA dehydrogenase NAD-binding domain-containing protein [Billgrantia endophytica]|uniref:3-hydroxybutyryl-CoA dehydrogenase n=1 Tax=Billgrantia endophytica TaxID=2033802 RepID=A0A2N7TV78_9GAMM|nr:3-hydroxyacyl-CoA dehydrogenase NAD-binding domain-containing protein [Halomonas endophytica]PMR72093.1 3-hydroxybutyryl-CoA dehydrogenase [Halomonas endophytica]
MSSQQNAIVVGAGTMGTTLARLMATHGLSVTVIDTSQETLARCRDRLVHDPGAAARVAFASEWCPGRAVDVVVESVTENIAVKRQVIEQAEAHVDSDTLIMTNTSGLSIDEIGESMAHPERFVGAHFFNPADVIPAVEVVPGSPTHPAAVERACQLLRRLGKRPAVLSRCVPGFVANRIQHAIMRECLHLIEQGVVEPAALDDIVKYSIGIRMAINGPLRQRDLNGLDTHLNIARYLYDDLSSSRTPAKLLENHVAEGFLGAKAGRGFYEWSEAELAAQSRQEREQLTHILSLIDSERDA